MKKIHKQGCFSRFTGLGNITVFTPLCQGYMGNTEAKTTYEDKEVTCKRCKKLSR